MLNCLKVISVVFFRLFLSAIRLKSFVGICIVLQGLLIGVLISPQCFARDEINFIEVSDGKTVPTVIDVINIDGIPNGIAVNPVTGFVYVSTDINHKSIKSIKRNDDTFDAIFESVFASNPNTNKTYIVNNVNNTVNVFTDRFREIASIEVGLNPVGIAINKGINKIYVANKDSSNVSVIDGKRSKLVSNVSVGKSPIAVAVNSSTNFIYVADEALKIVTVFEPEIIGIIPTRQ